MFNNSKQKLGSILIITTVILSVVLMLLADPIPQDPAYHLFVDTRMIFNIPNFWNVVSNLLFLMVGGVGLYRVFSLKRIVIDENNKVAYICLFSGITLTAFGSVYYHLWPTNETLAWDRLAMAISFMALLSIVFSEFISSKIGKTLLLPLLVLGICSVIYWYIGEVSGRGDLRFYALVQFLPLLLILIVFVFFHSRYTKSSAYWILLSAYTVAKFAEYYDAEVYRMLGFISGHSIKHIVAAMGLGVLLISFESRVVR